jgi:hypothetical protein
VRKRVGRLTPKEVRDLPNDGQQALAHFSAQRSGSHCTASGSILESTTSKQVLGSFNNYDFT